MCEDLLAQCPTDHGPSPLRVLGSCRGVRDIQSGHIDQATRCSGLLIPQDGGYVIVVSAAEPKGRQHFSAAHEITHTYFREVCPAATPSPQEEKLCDLGAVVLTMPAARFGPFLAARPLCLATINECHREFAVSITAAGRRAMELTDVSACLFVGEMARTLTQIRAGTGTPELRIVKWWPSVRWPFRDSHLNLPFSPRSLIGQAFTHQGERAGQGSLGLPFRAGTYAIEARGHRYPSGAGTRRVLALARGPLARLNGDRRGQRW
jgi:hypothetical protein